MDKLTLYRPIVVGKGRDAQTITLVKDIIGDLRDNANDEEYITTVIGPQECVSYVKEKELDSAKQNAPKLLSFGVSQLLLANGFIELDPEEQKTYICDIETNTRLFICIDVGSGPLDERLTCYYGYGGQLPPALTDLNMEDAERILVSPATIRLVPATPIRTAQEIEDLKHEKERASAFALIGGFVACFTVFFLYGFVISKIDALKVDKKKDLENELQVLSAQRDRLSKVKLPKMVDQREAVKRLTALYLADADMQTVPQSASVQPTSLTNPTVTIQLSENFVVEPIEALPWLASSQFVTAGGYQVSFSTALSDPFEGESQ